MRRQRAEAARLVSGAALFCLLVLAAGSAAAQSALHDAAANGDTAVVKDWIARKRNLNVTYDSPRRLEGNYARTLALTPLMVAATFGQLEVVKLLVEAGADLYAESHTPDGKNRRTAFDYAVEQQRVAVARYLWSKGDAAKLGARLPQYLGRGCSPGCTGELLRAHDEMTTFLIGIAPPEALVNKEVGETMCFTAHSEEGRQFLARHFARVPPSSLSCIAYYPRGLRFEQRRAAVTWLLDRGADPNDRSRPATPLMLAAAAHELEMVKLLVARGGDPNLRYGYAGTVIGYAANSCARGDNNPSRAPQAEVVEYLASVSDKNIYASAEARSKLELLGRCCAEEKAPEQRRICAAFGL